MKRYIRFKDIPKNERSGVYDGDLGMIREEAGVSVFECIEDNSGCFRIVLPSMDSGPLYDLVNFIEDFKEKKIPCYLVQGVRVGNGTYGEPVIVKVKILSKLELFDDSVPAPVFKMDRRNPQLRREEIPQPKKFIRPEGHKCSASTNICDQLSFGKGKLSFVGFHTLDHFGFWEIGCPECARAWEKQFPDDGVCWPPDDLL